MLGVDREGLVRDWELTSFSLIGLRYRSSSSYKDQFEALETYLNNQNGNTLQEKIENYLLGIGITAEQIQNIRDIML